MKKVFVCITAIALVLVLLAACGVQKPAGEATADVTKFTTLGEVLALSETEELQRSISENAIVFVFKNSGTYWRLTAKITPAQSEALFALDALDENYEKDLADQIADVAIEKCENLSEQILTEEERNALIGKTGEDLINEGWTDGMGYNLDDMEFYLELQPFAYTVVFEAEEALENTDDFDVLEAIRPLKVKSVTFFGLGNSATDLPVNAA